MTKLTHEELKALLIKARVVLGATMSHTKSGNLYEITSVHLREYDLEVCAEYAPIVDGATDAFIRFSRPLSEIQEKFLFVGGRVTGMPFNQMENQK